MAEEKKRKIGLPQLDEIWDAAKDQWGDPGLREPAPDPRFEGLRSLLNDIEDLFKQDRGEDLFGESISSGPTTARRKKKASRGSRQIYDEDEELPF